MDTSYDIIIPATHLQDYSVDGNHLRNIFKMEQHPERIPCRLTGHRCRNPLSLSLCAVGAKREENVLMFAIILRL